MKELHQSSAARHGFTLVELLVIIAIMVILVSLLVPTLTSASALGREAACASNLQQLGVALTSYSAARNGAMISFQSAGTWVSLLAEEYGDMETVPFCPEAPEQPTDAGWGRAQVAWRPGNTVGGSYGINGFVYDNSDGSGGGQWCSCCSHLDWFGSLEEATDRSPLFADAVWPDGWPSDRDRAPRNYIDPVHGECGTYMGRYCIDRHDFAVNVVFADAHVEKVELPMLWSLAWSKNFDVTRYENGNPRVIRPAN